MICIFNARMENIYDISGKEDINVDIPYRALELLEAHRVQAVIYDVLNEICAQ